MNFLLENIISQPIMYDMKSRFFDITYQNPRGKSQIWVSRLSNLKLSLEQNDGVGSVDVFAIVN